jgi:alkanesulfonate monooxygenase SsuD/methylene tetrahydromethanopterin reductase-like flavin-dependent oxidoreductase (luciferase family)
MTTFNVFLSCHHFSDPRSHEQLYADLVTQARHAEALGYDALSVPEHHFVNILMNPDLLMLAVHVANATERLPVSTAVIVLPFHDMRRFAGQAMLADILSNGRVELGVGRGAFAYEMSRMGIDPAETRARFDESLAVLEALFDGEDVSWKGEFYDFDPITVMPRSARRPKLWIAALGPEAIYHTARKGYDVQTTPLRGGFELAKKQMEAFHRGADEALAATGKRPRMSMLRSAYVGRDAADAREKAKVVYEYGLRFTNGFETPGTVSKGELEIVEVDYGFEDAMHQLIVGTKDEIIDKIGAYAELGMDEIALDMHLGIPSHNDIMDSMERFATDVMPLFRGEPVAAAVGS